MFLRTLIYVGGHTFIRFMLQSYVVAMWYWKLEILFYYYFIWTLSSAVARLSQVRHIYFKVLIQPVFTLPTWRKFTLLGNDFTQSSAWWKLGIVELNYCIFALVGVYCLPSSHPLVWPAIRRGTDKIRYYATVRYPSSSPLTAVDSP